MKYWIVLFFCLLGLQGCASYQADKFGNYNDVILTPNESTIIANDITQYLRQTLGVKGIVNINSDNSKFANTLMQTLRQAGLGVTQSQNSYKQLNYRVEMFNPTQFVVTINIGNVHFSRIWALTNNQLVPLPTRTVFGDIYG